MCAEACESTAEGTLYGFIIAECIPIQYFLQVEQLTDPQSIAAEIVKRCPAKQLMLQYRVPAFRDADEFLQHVAFRRGQLLPGGVGDAATAARVVLHDWHNGKIAYYTMPPQRESRAVGTAELVADWAKDFDADKVSAPAFKSVQHTSHCVLAGLGFHR